MKFVSDILPIILIIVILAVFGFGISMFLPMINAQHTLEVRNQQNEVVRKFIDIKKMGLGSGYVVFIHENNKIFYRLPEGWTIAKITK